MLYHFGTRNLSFLKSPTLLRVLETLAEHGTAREACITAGVAESELPTYGRALATLASSSMIVPDPRRRTAPTVSVPAFRRIAGADTVPAGRRPKGKLIDLFENGLTSPICLTWELTYACNLACVHCLSSSGRRDPRELTTSECQAVIDTLQRMQVFYVNIGGGEPTVRPDFWELVDYATAHQVGVKFSTNGIKLDAAAARKLAASDYIDVQISLDGATAEVNDAVRGLGSYETAIRAMANLAEAGFRGFKVSVVVTRHNVSQLDAFKQLADDHGAQLRLTSVRPWRRRVARAAPDRRAAAGTLRLAGRPRRAGAHRGLVLSPVAVREAAARAEHVRGGPRGLPHRSGGRRVRLPVRHPRELPGRERPAGRRLRNGVARVAAVRRPARAADRGSVPFLRVVRFVPWRVHGGQVLYWPAAGWAGSGVRSRPRRGCPGRHPAG
jgi:putative mycofactocin binding protein MftB